MGYLLSEDEYCRITYAYDWAANPFFAPFDHVWLAGHFYFLGGFFRLTGSMNAALFIFSITGWFALVAASFLLGKLICGARSGGYFAAILSTGYATWYWGVGNAWSELYGLSAYLFSIYFLLSYIQEKSPRLLLFSALTMAFGTMFRYEAWVGGILLGIFLTIHLPLAWRADNRQLLPWAIGAMLVLLLYPLAWMISSYRNLDSFTAFAAGGYSQNIEHNLFYDMSTLGNRLSLYTQTFWLDHWRAAPLAIAALILASAGKVPRPARYFFAIIGILFVAYTIMAARSGLGSATRERMTLFFLTPLLISGSIPFSILWQAAILPDNLRRFSRPAIALILFLMISIQFHVAVRSYLPAFGVEPGFLALVERVRKDSVAGREHREYQRIPPNGPDFIFTGGEAIHYWMLRHYNSQPNATRVFWSTEEFESNIPHLPSGSRLFLRRPYPEELISQRATHLLTIDDFEVWRVN